MNGQHLRAFLWLRWRLRVNQLKRGGIVNAVILAILSAAAVVLAAVLFAVSIPIGAFVLNDKPPAVLLYVWDGLVVAFLFFWTTGLLTDLQRFESLSLGKFLHLPVSLSSVFLINYLSSLPSVSLLLFLPAMLGLNLGLLFGRGPAMLLLLPMLASFLLMVTALTYQFQGWLAALMANPRRRRTVIVVVTMTFILISQAPQLVNVLYWQTWETVDELNEETKENNDFMQWLSSGPKSGKEIIEVQKKHDQRIAEIRREREARNHKSEEQRAQQTEKTAKLLNMLLPPGWLPAGVEAAAEGRAWPVALAILGPALIGTASLWRSYRTTLRLYTGQYNTGEAELRKSAFPSGSWERGSGQRRPEERESSRSQAPLRNAGREALLPGSSARLLEKKLPWLSEQAAVIALGGFRSLLRARRQRCFS